MRNDIIAEMRIAVKMLSVASKVSHLLTICCFIMWLFRQLISQLMMTESRKICFDAQELVITLLETFNFNFKLGEATILKTRWQ